MPIKEETKEALLRVFIDESLSAIGPKTDGFCPGFIAESTPLSSVKTPKQSYMVKASDANIDPTRPYSVQEYASHIAEQAAREKLASDIYEIAEVKVANVQLVPQSLDQAHIKGLKSEALLERFENAYNTRSFSNKRAKILGTSKQFENSSDARPGLMISFGSESESDSEMSPHDYHNPSKELLAKPVVMVASRIIEGFVDIGKAKVDSEKGKVPFMQYISETKKLPSEIEYGGAKVSLVGVPRLLAIAKFIGDTDAFGNAGGNCGFVIEGGDKEKKIAQIYKIDPGLIQSHDTDIFSGKDIKVAGSLESGVVSISYDKFTDSQKKEFIDGLQATLLLTKEDLIFMVKREGKFDSVMPKEQQNQLVNDLLERQEAMKLLYSEELARNDQKATEFKIEIEKGPRTHLSSLPLSPSSEHIVALRDGLSSADRETLSLLGAPTAKLNIRSSPAKGAVARLESERANTSKSRG